MQRNAVPLGLVAAALWSLCGSAQAQVFVKNTTSIPQGSPFNNSPTENVDFGDVDLDGDFDAVFADGGDQGNDQNRIWINRGFLQAGTIGTFSDETAARFPVLLDDSRDIEFVDFDNDGDLDIYNSNTSNFINQTNHWWTNNGGMQGGALGFYTDETSTRWVGLGGPGSSIPASSVLGPPFGGFIDWSCDCDFGDLDNDGDIDLFHSTYGGAFGGQVPSRIFLNDGSGKFSEFNPSAFQMLGTNILDGNPGLWCDGTQQGNTLDSSGANCDIASSALDIDLGDMDGDFDLDVLHGARQELPRIYRNRLESGALAFRDVTTVVLPAGYSTGSGHYEQEMGDADNDGDLDIYGLNWLSSFGLEDVMLRNTGTGIFVSETTLPGSGSDDNEGDFLDYDRDGDLDLFIANFSGADRLYRNDLTGAGYNYVLLSTAAAGTVGEGPSLDADCCDVDGDGDVDVFVAEDQGDDNKFMQSTLQVQDSFAPRIPNVEAVGGAIAAAGSRVFRAQVYDNESYYVTWYNPTAVEVSVDGWKLPDIKMQSSMGQVFRGKLPANLVGQVSFNVRSSDQYGNTGYSAAQVYSSSTSLSFATNYGSGAAGPLGVPSFQAVSVPFAGSSLYLAAGNIAPGAPYLLYAGDMALATPLVIPGLTTVNIGGTILFTRSGVVGASGQVVTAVPIPASAPAGIEVAFQFFTQDGVGGVTFASSNGVKIVSQ